MLATVFETELSEYLVFKGGTSLSKAWRLVSRLSEDIDLAVERAFFGFGGELSKSKRSELRKAAGAYITGPFFESLKIKLEEKGLANASVNIIQSDESDQDPRIIEINYPNIIRSPGYLEPKVKIEIGCRSLKEPFERQNITSLIDEAYADRDFAQSSISIPTVNPERTFLEKIFLLHEEFHKPARKIRVERLSRHLYDVYHLSKAGIGDRALQDKQLYKTIVLHRYAFTRVSGVDYNGLQPQSIDPIPIPEIIKNWEDDYDKMQEMIYEPDPPTFEAIIEEFKLLKEKVNTLPWNIDKEFPIK